MTPKEKAEELFVKINKEGLHQISSVIARHVRKEMIKQCAKITVDEIIVELESVEFNYNIKSSLPSEFWQEVKQEIEKL